MFCDMLNFSAGLLKSLIPAATRHHFIRGAQKNTVLGPVIQSEFYDKCVRWFNYTSWVAHEGLVPGGERCTSCSQHFIEVRLGFEMELSPKFLESKVRCVTGVTHHHAQRVKHLAFNPLSQEGK